MAQKASGREHGALGEATGFDADLGRIELAAPGGARGVASPGRGAERGRRERLPGPDAEGAVRLKAFMPIAVLTQDRDAGDLVERVGIADLPSSIRPHASCRCDRSAHRAAHSQSFPRSAASPQDPASNRNPIRQHQHWHHGGASLMAGLFLLPLILGVLLIASVLATLLLRFALLATASLCTRHGAWRLSRALGRTTRFVFGAAVGESLAFDWEMSALREAGKIAEAADIARTRVADGSLPPWSRNVAIDLLISAGAYSTALASEPPAPCRRTLATRSP